jgi:hypothetical protein
VPFPSLHLHLFFLLHHSLLANFVICRTLNSPN